MGIERVDPPGMRFPGMSQAVKAGGWVRVSGQVAMSGGKVIGIGDSRAQAEQCFRNVEASLAAAGARLDQVVSLNVYLTDRSAYAGYAEVKNKLFAATPPASTAVIVAGLLLDELLMEVEATAWVGE